MYAGQEDDLLALAEVESHDDRVRELKIYREQSKTQELIDKAITSFRDCVEKLTNPTFAQAMTTEERAYLFARMDWCKFTLDIVGEDPAKAERVVDDLVLEYARKAGLPV